MKKVTNIPDIEKIKEEIYNSMSEIVDSNIDKVYANIGPDTKKWLDPKHQMFIKIISIFTLFIPWLWMNYKLTKISAQIVSNIDTPALYTKAFASIKELDFIEMTKTDDTKTLYDNKIPYIPSKAHIDKFTNVMNFKINKKHHGHIQMGRATWRETNMNGDVETFYENTGYLKIKTENILPSLTYSLNRKHNILSKHVKLENPEFNKRLGLKANDLTQIRMVYTPLTMEETIKYRNEINKLKYWKVYKEGDEIKIIFRPKDWNAVDIFLVNKGLKSEDSIKDYLKKNITNNIVNLYIIIFVVLIPPML